MGWKNVKEHYRIGHLVAVWEGKGICIGSPYVHDLITVRPDGTVSWGTLGPSRTNDDLNRYFREMTADVEKLRQLMATPDTFARSIPVYTYEGKEIIEKQCEEPGWPNVTHDGDMMYENTFSTDKAKVVAWAKRNAKCWIESELSNIADYEVKLRECRQRLAVAEVNAAGLDLNYPDIAPAP